MQAGVKVMPLDATLGAVVTGVELARLDERTWATIAEAFLDHAVLVFPGQHLSEEAQVAFAERFGPIEYLAPERKLIRITNRKKDGSLLTDDDRRFKVMRGNEGWHTDSTYMPVSAKASVLSAHIVPQSGGETEWADMRAAYAALDPETRARIADLAAYHSYYYSQARTGHVAAAGDSYGFHDQPPPLRPLVKVHPETDRSVLFIGRHAYGIPGLSPEESERLLDGLIEFACRPPRVYAHRWRPGDVVVWDNRSVLHRVRPFDFREARLMKHVRVAGDPASEGAPQPGDAPPFGPSAAVGAYHPVA